MISRRSTIREVEEDGNESDASGPGPAAAALAAAREELERLRATVVEQAVVIHLAEGKAHGASSAGPVPPRVDARVKAAG